MSNTAASTPAGEDVMAQLIEQAELAFAAAWNAVSSMSPQLNALPHEIHDSLNDIYNRLTNNGTLSVLPSSWTETPVAWAYHTSPPSASAASSPPTVVAAPPASSSPIAFLGRHPYLVAFVVTSGGLGTAYYLNPAATSRVLRPLTSRLPVDLASLSPRSLVKRAKHPVRPARVLQHGHIEIRKEAVLILGCDSPLFTDLALDLEARGFVVIATVSNPGAVDALERRSRGWLKVLVLDGNDATSVAPFLRSLATALSLRFPLRSAGDPFARPAHALVLSACINALSIDADKNDLAPVEAMDVDTVRRYVGEKIATFTGVVRGVIPILRSAANRPDAPSGVFLHLAPSTSPLSPPFVSLSSASDAAISSLLTSLRRELHSTSSPSNIRVKSLSVGLFDVQAAPTSKKMAENLSTRISSLYSTSLSSRSSLLTTHHRKGTSPKRLYSRVFYILTCSSVSSLWTPSHVGAGAWVHRLATNWYPRWFTDSFLRLQNWLYTMYFSRRIGGPISSASTSTRLGGGGGGGTLPPSYASATSHRQRPPLPPTPSTSATGGQQHPASLRPGGTREKQSSSTPESTSRASSTASSEESGTEDLLSSSMHDGPDSGMGSFIHVPSTSSTGGANQGLFRQEI